MLFDPTVNRTGHFFLSLDYQFFLCMFLDVGAIFISRRRK